MSNAANLIRKALTQVILEANEPAIQKLFLLVLETSDHLEITLPYATAPNPNGYKITDEHGHVTIEAISKQNSEEEKEALEFLALRNPSMRGKKRQRR
jgi:hypothetical protein